MNDTAAKKILFLCTGNYYRSRFSEHLFNALAGQKGLPWYADSRGLAIEQGIYNQGAISPYTIQGLLPYGLKLGSSERWPQSAAENDFLLAQKIIAVDEQEHRPMMRKRFPRWVDEVEYWLIHDIDKVPPSVALPKLAEKIKQLVDSLAG
jgi:protein-tyrosine phosphatase